MDVLRPILENWFLREPMAILWMVIAAALLFGMAFVRSRGEDDGCAWSWFRRLLEALLPSLLFVGLLGMFSFLLNSNYADFRQVFGSFAVSGSKSNQAWQAEWESYGGIFVQRDLSVMQYIPIEEGEAVQLEISDEEASEDNHLGEKLITQTSITGFRGEVEIGLESERFNSYSFQAVYEYDIINPADTETRAVFRLPLSAHTILYEGFEVLMDGEDVPWVYDDTGAVTWSRKLAAGEKTSISIHYTAKGMESYLFELLEPRRITNFELVLFMKNGVYGSRTEPANGGIQLEEGFIEDGRYRFKWTIEDAIVSPHLGVNLYTGNYYAPFHEMVVSLPYAARAVMLFLSLAVLTSLIFSAPLKVRHVALLAGLFVLPYLVLMAGGVPAPDTIAPGDYAHFQVKMLPLLSVIPLVLAYYCLPKQPKSVLVLVLVLMALYMAGYPFIGLMLDERKRNAIEGAVQVGMIAYVFALTLFVRVRSLRKKRKAE